MTCATCYLTDASALLLMRRIRLVRVCRGRRGRGRRLRQFRFAVEPEYQ